MTTFCAHESGHGERFVGFGGEKAVSISLAMRYYVDWGRMDARLKRKSYVYGLAGIALTIAGLALAMTFGSESRPPHDESPLGLADWFAIGLVLIGRVFLVVGATYYAAALERSRWFGLLGMLEMLGILMLAFLRDRHAKRMSGLCMRCGYDVKGLQERVCPECGSAF